MPAAARFRCLCLVLAAAVLPLMLSACGGFFQARGSDGGGTSTNFLYVANFNAPGSTVGAGSVTAFSIATSGALTTIGTYQSGAQGATAVRLSPGNKFLFVSNDSGPISAFAVATDGSLSTVAGSPFLPPNSGGFTTNPTALAVLPSTSSPYLYVANFGTGDVTILTYNTTSGVLAELGASPVSAGSSAEPAALAINPAGTLLFVGAGGGGVVSFRINSDGTLTSRQIFTVPNGGTGDDVLVDSSGKFLYVADGTNDMIVAYQIDSSTGGLSQLGSPTDAGGAEPIALTTASITGFTLLYSANQTGDSLGAFTLANGGGLTTVSGSPFAAASAPAALRPSSDSKYLFVANAGASDSNGTGGVSIFTIDQSTGQLTSSSTANAGGPNPVSLAVTR